MSNEEKNEKKPRPFLRWLAVIVAGLVVGAGLAVLFIAIKTGDKQNKSVMKSDVESEREERGDSYDSDDAVPHSVSNTMKVSSSDVSDIVDNVLPSVVSVTCKSEVESNAFDDLFGYDFGYDFDIPKQIVETTSTGTGFIIGQNGNELLIATNNHVVEGAKNVNVEFVDSTTADAVIKGADAFYDVAVLSVDMSQLKEETIGKIKIATIGNSDDVKVGAMSIAIGNSLGYGQSVTVGYISALNRNVKKSDGSVMQLMQTDTIINSGNSGGPLLNVFGEVIGITSSKYGGTASGSKTEGMCFAIPITQVVPIINELMNRVELSPAEVGYLGIEGKEVSDSYAKSFKMPKGLYIYTVEKDSAADVAGLRAGDIITAINGRSISTMDELKEILQYKKYDTEIEVTYSTIGTKGYEEYTITVKLGKKSYFSNEGNW